MMCGMYIRRGPWLETIRKSKDIYGMEDARPLCERRRKGFVNCYQKASKKTASDENLMLPARYKKVQREKHCNTPGPVPCGSR
jgi:hypothetical protein